jgi:hypothetical protein
MTGHRSQSPIHQHTAGSNRGPSFTFQQDFDSFIIVEFNRDLSVFIRVEYQTGKWAELRPAGKISRLLV